MFFICMVPIAAWTYFRGKVSFDQSGVGMEMPGEVSNVDDEFDMYRKRMMLAYRFRPNPLVRNKQYQYCHASSTFTLE